MTALFVLQAPLCAFACLAGTGAAAMAAADHGDAPPCHEPAPDAPPADPAEAPEDCGCAESYSAVVQGAESSSAGSSAAVGLPPTTASDSMAPRHRLAKRAPAHETDLPPPDILLLKATLLI